MKNTSHRLEKMFANDKSDTRLIGRVYQNSHNSLIQTQTTRLHDSSRRFTKGDTKMADKHAERCSNHESLGKSKSKHDGMLFHTH